MAEIRYAKPEEVDALLALGQRMYNEGPNFHAFDFAPEKARKIIARLVELNCCLVAVVGNVIIGTLCFTISEHLWGHDKIAADVAFYVEPEYRSGFTVVRLVREYERVATARGARMKDLGVSSGVDTERTVQLLERLGYTPYSVGTRKGVNNVQH